ncbi:MAG: sigma-70 family RNA polymerase sigma factor [Candidatus Paceibacterota bacterium]
MQRAIPLTDWDTIRETHAPMVWSTVARILKRHDDALDCFQDVFAEAITRGRRGPVTDWGALLRWLATRRAIDCLRRRKRQSTVSGNVEQVRDATQSAEQRAAFEELVECVRSELGNLPDRQAEAFWLVCVEERTYEEVAQQMRVQRNAVGVLVHRARQHMRTKLKSLNPIQTD